MKRVARLLQSLVWPWETAVRRQAAKAAEWFLEKECCCISTGFAAKDGQLLVSIEGCLQPRYAEAAERDPLLCTKLLAGYVEEVCAWERCGPVMVFREAEGCTRPRARVLVTAASVVPRQNRWLFVGSDLQGKLQ